MSIIVTSQARCRDCYKCIRHCPVKAIGLKGGQAWVVTDKCIACGKCVTVCPQGAKSPVSQIDRFAELLNSGDPVVVSLAPSYLAAGDYQTPWKIVAALKLLGVSRVEETALGAELIAREYYRKFANNKRRRPLISSCCPVVVALIEKYFPSLIHYFPAVVSPMVAHARQIKQCLGDNVKVVFIGPCLAKKVEAESEPTGAVDAVLTFTELMTYFKDRNINPDSLQDEYPDSSATTARTFPLVRGTLGAAGLESAASGDIISINGIEECIETFKDIENGNFTPLFVEALACKGGCIGGPAIGNSLGTAARQKRLLDYAGRAAFDSTDLAVATAFTDLDLSREHTVQATSRQLPSEAEIRAILALTGKFSAEDETNCGGCGYKTCREKAIAVYQGLAEPEMCIPYMREKAENLSDAIVDSTPNAIIVVDKDMIVQKFNLAAEVLFNRQRVKSKGKHLSVFIDPTDFEKVWRTQKAIVDGRRAYPQYNLMTRQTIYPLEKFGVVIGIITDISQEEKNKAKMAKMRRESLKRASKVIREQMQVAQQIAGLLGESTAETKATLLELLEIMEDGEAMGSEHQD